MPRDAGRNAQTLRLLGLLDHLAPLRHGATLEELAQHFGVETRTIRRDFAAIEALGYTITKPVESGKTRYRLDSEFARRIPQASLTVDELTALALAFDTGSDTMPYGAQLAAARRKIEAALPERLRAFMIAARTALCAHLAPPLAATNAQQAHFLQALITATREHRRVMMGYGAAYSGTLKRYRLEPYRVVAAQGAFYVVAWVPSGARWRVFAVHRIKTLSLMDASFEPTQPLAADPFGHSLGPFIGDPEHVELQFSPESAPYVAERRWHSSQRVRRLPGRRLHLSLDVSIDYALKSWILGFGRTVEVLAPDTLVAWRHGEAVAILGLDTVSLAQARTWDASLSSSVGESWRLAAAADEAHAQAPLPFSTDWQPSPPPVIVADARGAAPSEAYQAYVATVARRRGRLPVATATTTARTGR